MTDLYRNPNCELVSVTTPHDFFSGQSRMYCYHCGRVTLHSMRTEGGATFYKCGECEKEYNRRGAIR